MRGFAVFLGLCSLLLAGGCGYQLVRYSEAPADSHRVAILGFSNETFEPGLDSLVSDAIYREFMRRGAVRLVDDPAAADLVIGGAVQDLSTRSRSFSSIQFALEYEVRLGLELALTRRDGTEVLVDGRSLRESELYFASADVETARTNREEAIRRLAGNLAVRVHDVLYERISP